MSIVEKQVIRFRPDRRIQGRAVDLGFEGDNMVRRLVFDVPEVDEGQTVTLMYGGRYADMIQLRPEEGRWAADLTAEMVGAAGVVDGYIRVDGPQGEVWHSDVFKIETGDVLEIEVEIEKLYPTAVSQMMEAMAAHRAEMTATEERVDERAGEAENAAERAQTAASAADGASLAAIQYRNAAQEAAERAAESEGDAAVSAEQAAQHVVSAQKAVGEAQSAAAQSANHEAGAAENAQEALNQARAAAQSAADAKAHAESIGEAAAKAESEANRAEAAADGLESPSAQAKTLAAGAQATAQWSKDAQGNPVLELGIPKGDRGDKGDAFTYEDFTEDQLKGLTGPAGADGYTPVKGVDYFDGKDGEPGKDGKSAYQYAQEGGYAGTEMEFAEKLAAEYLTQEVDPTVPGWAKQPTKPTYTAEEIGAAPEIDNVLVTDKNPWSSKNIVDRLCSAFETTGPMVTCHPVEGYPLGVKSRIEPVQSGSGDPSPDNIRPISGWDKVVLTKCGKNLLNPDEYAASTVVGGLTVTRDGGVVTLNGTTTLAETGVADYDLNPLRTTLPPGTYAVSGSPAGGDIYTYRIFVYVVRADGTNAYISDTGKGATFTISDGDVVQLITIRIGGQIGTVNNLTFTPQLEYAAANTEYEPYQGETYTAQFPETVYGGMYDWGAGVLTVTHDSQGNALAKPYTIQLIPRQITALSGVNTIWSNTGDTGVSGHAVPYVPATRETLGSVMAGKGLTVDKNGRLSVIESIIDTLDLSDMATIQAIVQAGQGPDFFPIGDQIIIPWKDMDDSAHNTDETAYQVVLDIVHHGEVTLESGEVVPGMFLQWHHCSPYGVQFSHQQAFLNCPDGLAAGTYYVTLARNWGNNAVANTNWSFTLTKAVPAGGRLSGFESMPDQATSTWKVKSWSTPADAEPLETVSVTSGATGTHLGLMPYTNPNEATGLNCMQSVAYGHNRWDTSALRQYLNASGTDWWVSKEDYDIRPDQYAKHAFMSGFNDDFLSAIKPVRVTTALNTVEGYTETTVDTFDRFFLPSLEQMNVVPQLSGAEGEYWAYWRRRLGVSAPVAQYGSYPNLITTAINAKTSPQAVRLRSAYRGGSYGMWIVNTSGYVNTTSSSNVFRFSPVCVVC